MVTDDAWSVVTLEILYWRLHLTSRYINIERMFQRFTRFQNNVSALILNRAAMFTLWNLPTLFHIILLPTLIAFAAYFHDTVQTRGSGIEDIGQ